MSDAIPTTISAADDGVLRLRDYLRVFGTFFRNSAIREMTFRANFLIQIVTRTFWFATQLALFAVIYDSVPQINGWTWEEYIGFMATGMLINAIVETFCMPNCASFSELIRSGNLDFALLKPIDTQFLVSFEKVNLAMLNQVLMALALLVYALVKLQAEVTIGQVVVYAAFVVIAVVFFYSLMISLACTSIWFGRNQGLYDFWFYITVFARYPRSIYDGEDPQRFESGEALQFVFSYVMPILLVVTVPARILVKQLDHWEWAVAAGLGAVVGLWLSRKIFRLALLSYRSASS
jgi:ABC-2 type transport system permease protein